MANDKSYDRHINIWINGKEVKNDVASIQKEWFKLNQELKKTTVGSKEYYDKINEMKKLDKILVNHRNEVKGTGDSWTKLKGLFSSAQGLVLAGIAGITAGYQSLKTVIFSTDALGDKFEKTLGGWKGGLDAVARAIATMNFKDLGKNIRDAINEGRRYAEELDQLDEKTRALKIAEAEGRNELFKQREIQNDTRKSLTERNNAGLEAIRIEEDLAVIRTGIAEQGFKNEATNIANISRLTDQEVLAYAKQEKAILANLQAGRAYNQYVKERTVLQTISLQGVRLTEEQISRYGFLNNAIATASEETKRFAFAAANMPGDEKMQLFVDKYVAWQEAIGSARENTLRVRSKQATTEVQLNKEEIKGAEDVTKAKIDALEEQAAAQLAFAQLEEENRKEILKLEQQSEQETIEEEVKLREELYQAEKNLSDKELEDARKLADEKLSIEEALYQAKREFVNNAFQLGATLFDAQSAKLDEQYKKDIAAAGDNANRKAQIDAEYNKKKNALSRKAAIAEKLSALFSIGLDTAKGAVNAASKVITLPLVPWIIANGAIQAAIVAARPVPQFWTGGYSGKGGKYEPKGIVHGGEWVANAEMVSSPTFGPVIQALENKRASGLKGYADGGMTSGTGTAGGNVAGSTSIFGMDPKVASTLNRIDKWLEHLNRNGVNMKFGYVEADNVRKGMDKLDEIEEGVTL
jgi:hypothetical protein